MLYGKLIICGAALAVAAACTAPRREHSSIGYAGLTAIAECDFEAAELLYTRASRDAPENPYYRLGLGVAQQRLGKTDLAAANYRKAIELGADQPVGSAAAPCSKKPGERTVIAKANTTVGDMARENLAMINGGQ